MFDKIKSRKAPISLSSVSNAIKTSGNTDLSPNDLHAKQIDIYTASQLGIPKNSILAVAHDPVQSLLAISTNKNEIRVYGQNHVEVVFEFKQTSPITDLMFVRGIYLVAASTKGGGITVISLHQKTILGTYSPPGAITAVCSDPSLDWLIVGLANGQIVVYDVDRTNLTPFRVDNLQKRILPKEKLSAVLAIEWHPRDIGSILVTYSHSTVLFSMVTGEIVSSFVYELKKGSAGFARAQYIANDGKKKLFGSSSAPVIPEVIESHFHPNGLHIVTIHRDNSIVFWDAQDGTLLQARGLFELNLTGPAPPDSSAFSPPTIENEIQTCKWVCGADPENTQLIVAVANNVHVFDFGVTLKYSMTTHERQSGFYGSPANGQSVIPITFNAGKSDQVEFLDKIVPITLDGIPYFSGCSNPSYLILLSNKGAFYLAEYKSSNSKNAPAAAAPSKPAFDPYSISKGTSYSDYADFDSNNSQGGDASSTKPDTFLVLPPSVGLVQPPVVFSQVVQVRKIDWFGICSGKSNASALDNPTLLKGGAPADNFRKTPKPIGYDDVSKNILVTGHERGRVRMLDISRGEHQDLQDILQISLVGVLHKTSSSSLNVDEVSCAFESKEVLIGMKNGYVVVCKFGRSKNGSSGDFSKRDYSDCPVMHKNNDASIISISHRVPKNLSNSNTFFPFALLTIPTATKDRISCLKMSDVGFAAIAYKSGRLIVCDISRGPAIIANYESILQFIPSVQGVCYATTMEFSILEFGQDGYSSVMLTLGTCAGGNLLMFKIIPQANGAFECVFVDKTLGLNYKSKDNSSPEDSKLTQIIPISVKNGDSSIAQLSMFQKLSQGIVIPSYVIISSARDVRIMKLPKQKLSHKVIEETCLRTGIIRIRGKGIMLAVLLRTGFIKFLSVPSLNEIIDFKLPKDIYLQVRDALESGIASDSDILPSGEIFLRTGQSECILLSTFLQDQKIGKKSVETKTDLLFNENAIIPLRPSAGSLQWVKGQTKYVSLQDLNVLIAGPNRKPPKNEETRLAFNISPEANPNQSYGFAAGSSNSGTSAKDYKDPVRGGANSKGGYNFGTNGFMRSLQTGIESIEESVNGYANNMSEAMTESVEGSKKSMYSAALKNKMGF
ncbi:lethal(2) giant larvae protein homolog Sro77p [[Candida] railenensis]|uniref:Lethal(2) giant larvae protein homolog Sro77p n=1 Tax=[Candida] railenensis TaxID=45579 RepID=A0A9P0QM05_9ASCO|nr:lethal(2) giant larvae protein homolog Sro77p [[Candida] railenensis]